MRPEVMEQLREAHDIYSLTKGVLELCEPYVPVHSFKLVHNRGAARVVCFIELESQREQPALVRALVAPPECAPLTKAGGLGDVAAALPAALGAQGNDVRILLPRYREIDAAGAEERAQLRLLGMEVRVLEQGECLLVDVPALYD